MDLQLLLKRLPSVEKVLTDDRVSILITPSSRRGITCLVREAIDDYRRLLIESKKIVKGKDEDIAGTIVENVVGEVKRLTRSSFKRVINAAGVVLYTNLGRAVLGKEVQAEITKAASGYIDLEIDLESGRRVKRERHVAKLLSLLTGSKIGRAHV